MCSDTGVDTEANTIWANVTETEADGLAGTPFVAGGAVAGGLSSGIIAVIVIGTLAAAAIIAYLVIRMRRGAPQAV